MLADRPWIINFNVKAEMLVFLCFAHPYNALLNGPLSTIDEEAKIDKNQPRPCVQCGRSDQRQQRGRPELLPRAASDADCTGYVRGGGGSDDKDEVETLPCVNRHKLEVESETIPPAPARGGEIWRLKQPSQQSHFMSMRCGKAGKGRFTYRQGHIHARARARRRTWRACGNTQCLV